MRIVIVGSGKVGTTLAEGLVKEKHDVVVIDNKIEALKGISDILDVMVVQGNGASCDVQIEAGVPEADLVIATTAYDELNMLACVFARKLGAQHTIARVRNPEYYNQLRLMQDELGLSMAINPELEAATEISRILRFPAAVNIETFAQGNIEIIEFKIREGSPLIGMTLVNMRKKYGDGILVCAVRRGEEVYIPNGDFVFKEGDSAHITAKPSVVNEFFKSIGVFKGKVKNALIVGGGRISYYLVRLLDEIGIKAKIIEKDEIKCLQLSEQLPKTIIINGDGLEQELLNEEGIDDTDAFIALTGNDEENIILSMYANQRKVDKIITKINRQSLIDIVNDINIESVVSPKSVTADSILRYVRAMQNSFMSNIETLHQVVHGKVEALEFCITADTEIVGIPLKDMELKKNILVACIFRKGKVIIPGGMDELKCGDRVLIITTNKQFNDIKDILR